MRQAVELTERHPKAVARDLLGHLAAGSPLELDVETFTPDEVVGALLGRLREDAERRLGEAVEGAVLAVPSDLAEDLRKRIHAAATQAGWLVDALVPACAAAVPQGSIACGNRALHLVLDWSADRFSGSLLLVGQGEITVVKTATGPGIGATRFRDAVTAFALERIQQEFGVDGRKQAKFLLGLHTAVERAVLQLSSRETACIVVIGKLKGKGREVLDVEIDLSRAELEKLLSPIVSEALETVARLLGELGVTPEQVDTVGITSSAPLPPLVERLVCERFGPDRTRNDFSPEDSVAFGAFHLAESGKESVRVSSAGDAGALLREYSHPPSEPVPAGVHAPAGEVSESVEEPAVEVRVEIEPEVEEEPAAAPEPEEAPPAQEAMEPQPEAVEEPLEQVEPQREEVAQEEPEPEEAVVAEQPADEAEGAPPVSPEAEVKEEAPPEAVVTEEEPAEPAADEEPVSVQAVEVRAQEKEPESAAPSGVEEREEAESAVPAPEEEEPVSAAPSAGPPSRRPARRYRLVRRLYDDTHYSCYLAEDTLTGGSVRVRAYPCDNERAQDLFAHALTAGHLRHANVERILAVEIGDDAFLVVTEASNMVSLREMMRRQPKPDRPLPLKQSLTIAIGLCEALRAVHDAGIFHRNIKPENILVSESDDSAQLTGFEICKLLPRGQHVRSVAGTPAYIAPEILRGRADQRADVYSAAVVLYEMVTGRVPFRERDIDRLRSRLMSEIPTPPMSINPAVSRELNAIVMGGLEKDPARRRLEAGDLRAVLRRGPQ
jgi:hypothetical protein